MRGRRERIGGWGNHPLEECVLYRPERLEEMRGVVLAAPEPSLISRGAGRSYGDAALNRERGVLLHERLDRMLAFDPATGLLHCEAAVTLAEIIDILLPKGFFLAITPGTKYISVGGAIAADVHGKNHHRDGTISSQLVDFHVLTANGEVRHCSRDENSDLFWASIGGMGLTGIILDARLRMRSVETAWVHGVTEHAANLEIALQRIHESDRDYAYAVAWIDCLARGRSLGRSVLLRANPARPEELPRSHSSEPLASPRHHAWNVPFTLPAATLNRFSVKLFNALFYAAHRDAHAITDYESYFYPLDAVSHWNRIYGRRGVLQYQVVLPFSESPAALAAILEKVTASTGASFLAVLKSTGEGNRAPLSFPMLGTTLALDFPYTGPKLLGLLDDLDELVLRHAGRVYLAKDARLRAEHLPAMYPRLGEFREIASKYDPNNRFSSSLSRRLRILGEAAR